MLRAREKTEWKHERAGKAPQWRRGRFLAPGWLFALMILLLLLAAWNTGVGLLYVMLASVTSFVVLSIPLSKRNLGALKFQRRAPHAVHRGESFLMDLRLENHKWMLPAISVRMEDTDPSAKVLGLFLYVPPKRAALLHASHCLEKRGVYTLPPIDVVTSFPFGLLEHRLRHTDQTEIVVYPRISPIRTSFVEQIAGGRTVARVASSDGDEYFGMREYIPGDDIRHIAWRLSARMGKWMVRELSCESSRHVILALDCRWVSDMENFPERFEESVDLAASIAVALLRQQYDVSLVAPEAFLEGGEGSHQEKRVLDILARVQAVDAGSAPNFDGLVESLAKGPVKLVYISPNERLWGLQFGLGRGYVLDPREVVYV
jgi:uncharacterized protein (DUF58 family)